MAGLFLLVVFTLRSHAEHEDFFILGREFRIPDFWATTSSIEIADMFNTRAHAAGFPQVRWVIHVAPIDRCFRVNFISRSLIADAQGKPQEDEFLFAYF